MTTYFTYLDIDFYIVLFQGLIPTTTTTPLEYPDIIEMVQRKPVGNPDDFFTKTIHSKSELLHEFLGFSTKKLG